ncbi:SDR family oxidoreductase [Lentzea sp. NEAU-D7]|uniref:SDR family oxidoreductase n=1 Tax=Lentzea sp. NEAU-D7 TaxID=2994667 RepID=UPI00224ABEE0|nr:SDR family oxidoreductase [Lentzea sp. NEAU-D7]MCX2948866.1 SDR family oxidoreductase [Lentzea sp. NEAU-D7]
MGTSLGPQVVVVTGATGGVGRATARAFARRGDRVALLARGENGLQAASDEVRRLGGVPLPLPTDMADNNAVSAAADRIEEELGPADVWVNNGFTTVFAPFSEIEPDEFRRVTEVTYLGYVNGTRAALRQMVPRGRGTIVQVGSALAYRGIPLQSPYCGAKHAIQGFTESLRCELMHDRSGLEITMVQLPALNTPQFDWALSRMRRKATPVAPIYQPELAAKAITYAADHPDRREYWLGASTVATLMANRLMPGLLDRYLARTGYEAQQTDQLEDPDRPANLWEPVDGTGPDFGAQGRFGPHQRDHSPQLWLSQHRKAVSVVTLLCGAAAYLRWRGRE